MRAFQSPFEIKKICVQFHFQKFKIKNGLKEALKTKFIKRIPTNSDECDDNSDETF